MGFNLEYFFAFLLSYAIAFVLSPRVLAILKSHKLKQEERLEGPESHKAKSGTPTMGGLIFITSTIIATLIFARADIGLAVYYLLFMVLFGIIGFADDYVKVVNKRNLGLTEKQKLVVQIIFALILGYLSLVINKGNTDLVVPFTSFKIHTGFLYIPLTALVIVATTNSVNLTDGVDGLASSVTAIVMFAFAMIAINFYYVSLTYFCLAVCGGCLGFLRINAYKAKCFMGDTGSMALGGAVSAAAIAMNMHFIIIIIGIIYVIEALSVIIQVYSFKKFGKRVFKMSPFHHHLELSGYNEIKVVKTFCVVTLVFSLVGILSVMFI